MASRHPLAEGVLATDQYQLTMAQLYLRHGLHDRIVRFEHFFRSYPDYGDHQAGYCITAGLAWLVERMQHVHPTEQDVEALRAHRSVSGEPLFDEAFLAWFAAHGGSDALTLGAVPEGRVVHPNTPITVVEGPLAQAQLLETPLLNELNYQTLIATKASRVVEAGRGRPVLEFGLRRAPERGGHAAGRAAIIGGATATSNAGLAHDLGLTPAGTHAHSMVQVFRALGHGELGAFEAYADVYPDDCLLLVDTIDTLESGLPNAIRVFEQLRRKGHRPLGIRLDSGDLAYLSIQAADMLDRAGFGDTTIVLSSQLDELTLWQILAQIEEEAPRYGVDADHVIGRLAYGVGSRLVTSHGDPSLDGVYKLVAVHDAGAWIPAVKVSDSPEKVLNPGAKHLWRVEDHRGRATADVLALAGEVLEPGRALRLHHHAQPAVTRLLPGERVAGTEELLVTIVREGTVVVDGGQEALGDLGAARERRTADLARLDPGVRRLVNPHVYHVSITDGLLALKEEVVARASAGLA